MSPSNLMGKYGVWSLAISILSIAYDLFLLKLNSAHFYRIAFNFCTNGIVDKDFALSVIHCPDFLDVSLYYTALLFALIAIVLAIIGLIRKENKAICFILMTLPLVVLLFFICVYILSNLSGFSGH